MNDRFIYDENNIYNIENDMNNENIYIRRDDKYLSIHMNKNILTWSFTKKDQWKIEKDDDNSLYISLVSERNDGLKYLGVPNQNNKVFLYTTKNRYTKWNIEEIGNNRYLLKYIGYKFDPNKIHIVVARYHEDIEWTNAYRDITIIYNKSENKNLISDSYNIPLANVGREGHTYLYYMITNYHRLPERVIFLQANFFDHNPTIFYGIDNFFDHDPIQPLGYRYLKDKNIPPTSLLENYEKTTDYGLKYAIIPVSNNLITIPAFPDNGLDNIIVNARKEYNHPFWLKMSIMEGFLRRSRFPINTPFPSKINFTYCGLFSLSRDVIRQHHVHVYIHLLNELIRLNKQGGTNGYVLERLWLYIFGYSLPQ